MCGSEQLHRASLFDRARREARLDDAGPEPDWLVELGPSLEPGQYLILEHGGEPTPIRLRKAWTRIGRSGAADVRLDHPQVSFRHAIVTRQGRRTVNVVDDDSASGVCVNGSRIDWRVLHDGDRMEIGPYCFHYLDTEAREVVRRWPQPGPFTRPVEGRPLSRGADDQPALH